MNSRLLLQPQIGTSRKHIRNMRQMVQPIEPPVAISPYRGADQQDVIDTTRSIELLFDLFGSCLQAHLQNLSENMPSTSAIDVQEWMNRLADMRGDLVGALMDAEESCS